MIFCGRELPVQDTVEALRVDIIRDKGRAGRFMSWPAVLDLLRDPVTKEALRSEGGVLASATGTYAIRDGNPILYPCDMERVRQVLAGPGALAAFPNLQPIEQYCAFGMLKAAGDNNNLDFNDVWYGRHLARASKLLRGAAGPFLDIGCDDVFLSRGMLGADVEYVGLEPSTGRSAAMRVCGLGEFLPFADESFDGVGFQTSLDHVFDYHLALSEAHRVLRPGGRLYLATLLWTRSAQLYTDTVHFHHFRAGQIEAALAGGFELDQADAYNWKDNTHRVGVYLSAVKR